MRRRSVALTVLIPDSLPVEQLSWLPERHIERVREPAVAPAGLVRDACLFQRMIRTARTRHPEAVFHSPAPAWAPSRRPDTIVTLHDCIYRRFPRYLGRRFRKRLVFASERYAAASRRAAHRSRIARRKTWFNRPGFREGKNRCYL